MSLGEERVYQTLWHGRESDGVFVENKRSKTFSLGYDRIARLVRLNEKSVRILLPKLIYKKILEVVAAENSASRLGRTYRIFSYEEILDRQRAENLTTVVKNGRAVEFVWPEGTTIGEPPAVRPVPEANGRSSGMHARGGTATVSTPRLHEDKSARVAAKANAADASGGRSQVPPPELASKVREVVDSFDDDALRILWTKCIERAPDCTSEEVEYCLELKAKQLLRRGKAVTNPVGLMLSAVPKCFEGPSALHLAYRQQKRAAEELRRQADEEFRRQIEEYRRLVADPTTNPEDRAWYEDILNKTD
jgi:hypothetical protein